MKPSYQTNLKGVAAKATHKKQRPRQRLGSDGVAEPVVDYMNHAPVHSVFLFSKGLFAPIKNGTRSRGTNAKGVYTHAGWKVECLWYGPEALDITDQLVFLHLCQRAARGSEAFLVDAKHQQRSEVSHAIMLNGLLETQPMMALYVTGSGIANEIGLTRTGSNSQSMLASIKRMAAITMDRNATSPDGGSFTGSSKLIGLFVQDNRYVVVLNPEATLRAKDHKGVVWVNMREQLALRHSKPAQRLHAWLCAWGSSWETKSITTDKLAVNVWGSEPGTSNVKKDRLRTLKAAIKSVAQLPGWYCEIDSQTGLVRLRKPIFVGTPTEAVATPTKCANATTECAATPTAESAEAAPDKAYSA